MKRINQNEIQLKYITSLKYLICAAIMIWGCANSNNIFSLLGIFELITVFVITDMIALKNIVVANLVNFILMFIFNIQYVVLGFGNTFISMIMYTNLSSLSALGGKLSIYITAVAFAVLASMIPVSSILTYKQYKMQIVFITLFFITFIEFRWTGITPYSSLFQLGNSIYSMNMLEKKLHSENVYFDKTLLLQFYNEKVEGGIERPAQLASKPNIVLIFTEGLSQNIIDDERNIMPNIRQFESEAVYFENYYNHTAATYRGIIGSLYSAHQFNNNDKNCLVSLQSVMKKNGYHTLFLNPEPVNKDFSQYLCDLEFDEVVTDDRFDVVPDEDMYQLLSKELTQNVSKPKFIAMYTFKTHIGQTNGDASLEKSSTDYLDKFTNLDVQFGEFYASIKDTNTVVIFTTDHATNYDEDFENYFPNYQREDCFCDRIPLAIWYPGVEAKSIDVNGRNSLGLAPTILDLLDYEYENYFMGDSLYLCDLDKKKELINTTFIVPIVDWFTSTRNNEIIALDGQDKDYVHNMIFNYLTLTAQAENVVE